MPKKTKDFQEVKIGCLEKKSEKNKTLVLISEYRGTHYANIRNWYRKSEEGEWLPGKGISVNVSLLPKLVRMLRKAIKVCLELGLLTEEDLAPKKPVRDKIRKEPLASRKRTRR